MFDAGMRVTTVRWVVRVRRRSASRRVVPWGRARGGVILVTVNQVLVRPCARRGRCV